MKISVLGVWHQGAVAAACLADMGFEVVGADEDAARVADLSKGRAPLFEPGLDALLEEGVACGRLTFTTDMAAAVQNAPFVFVAFDTPVNENDESDLSGIFATFERIAPVVAEGAVIFVTAQVPVGTCDQLISIINTTKPNRHVSIAYSPENLRLGQAIERYRTPPLPVIGCDDKATFDRLMEVMRPMAVKWEHVTLRTAEMVKHALNAFLAVSICFANELGNICDEVGADGKRVGEVLRIEPRIGAKAMLLPGLGFSGGTLARDIQTMRGLGRKYGIDTPLLNGTWQSNGEQNRLVLRKLSRALKDLRGAHVAVLGVTYKPDTSTLRRSAALEVIADLIAAGAEVRAHDPKVDIGELKRSSQCTYCDSPLGAMEAADAVVLMTPWKDYKAIDFKAAKAAMAGTYVLDTAGLWDPEQVVAAGLQFDDIGRGRRKA
ncbi:MAG: UDP-glucose/GDP-mannose dehydrogenase family protein [Alphaproteobacteria bacterium]|nr:UDP-glucose/GDP-mannose dehydrogenase family protein [Alphaproteobacteria bacterium]